MIEITGFHTEDTYFAARNGHGGFASHFDRVFAPRDYRKIFILKGGPGTGKSTLMRGLVSFANKKGMPCEAILCSSDVSSLDGVIIKIDEGRVAVIDGTAPHATDPKYPGAIEEIVDLGEGFNISRLEAVRGDIISHASEKSAAYSAAYSSLRLAGDEFDEIWRQLHESEIYIEADEIANNLAEGEEKTDKRRASGEILYSAFGKNGYYRLPITGGMHCVKIGGHPLVCGLLGSLLLRALRARGAVIRIARSALDDRLIDRLYTPERVYAFGEDGECDIDLSDLSLPDRAVCDYERYTGLLKDAAEHFEDASRNHFALEGIYRECVDFSHNDRVFERLCDRITGYLT